MSVDATESPATTISIAEYADRLAAAIRTLNDSGHSTEDRARALDSLAEIDTVTLASGETVTPVALHELLAEWDPQVPVAAAETAEATETAVARLGVILEQITQVSGDATETRLALLREVLARPVFLEQESWLERVRRWFVDWFDAWIQRWFPDWQTGGEGLPPEVMTVVGWVVVLAAAGALIWLGSYWLQNLLANLRGADAQIRDDSAEAIPVSAVAARQQAQSAAAAGDYRQAVRRLYLAALLLLDEHELLRFDPSQTNREVLAAVPRASAISGPLAAVVDTFDAVWYGIRIPDESTYTRYAADIDVLEQAARRARTGAQGDESAP